MRPLASLQAVREDSRPLLPPENSLLRLVVSHDSASCCGLFLVLSLPSSKLQGSHAAELFKVDGTASRALWLWTLLHLLRSWRTRRPASAAPNSALRCRRSHADGFSSPRLAANASTQEQGLPAVFVLVRPLSRDARRSEIAVLRIRSRQRAPQSLTRPDAYLPCATASHLSPAATSPRTNASHIWTELSSQFQ